MSEQKVDEHFKKINKNIAEFELSFARLNKEIEGLREIIRILYERLIKEHRRKNGINRVGAKKSR